MAFFISTEIVLSIDGNSQPSQKIPSASSAGFFVLFLQENEKNQFSLNCINRACLVKQIFYSIISA
ncbi:hypothetical protein A2442_03115 [Candidatus Campbellbacteria bacterium RIFOXYC2_FULL_35_25]|uniref:Uncharacterized protein n=1 Tax=Candidatus Campbellbacteria bacterium RIFOXYC2_FULL_35_25 TaxID=1797582 RepID=A0A1F5EJ73_9BACT|nr:MAG: hypothetical protein A2442_03115 [Candidatus Campbellbacteria bacterium RIFOXYC2_FULL_35_25]